ncbi:MAG: TorF family putative porin [bacterium]
MKISYCKMKTFLLVILSFISCFPVYSQELSVGTDFVSRYIWRGADLGGNTPSLHPTVEFSIAGLTAGFWGAYSLSDWRGLNEVDIYLNYSIELENSGSINFGVIDYMNPNSGVKLGNFNNYDDPEGSGAHYIELNLGFTGTESLPISFSLNYFVHNLVDNPIYFEFGYSTSVNDIGLDLFLGGTPGDDGEYYGVADFSMIHFGFTASKEIKITEDFSLPLFGSIIINPASEDLFYVVGISL